MRLGVTLAVCQYGFSELLGRRGASGSGVTPVELFFESGYILAELYRFFEIKLVGGGFHFPRKRIYGFPEARRVGRKGFLRDFESVFYVMSDRLRNNSVVFIVLILNFAAAVGFGYGAVHTSRNIVRVHYYSAFIVARGSAYRLDKRGIASEEAFFIRVENGYEFNRRKVQTLAEKIDSDENVESVVFEGRDYVYPFERVYVAVHILDSYFAFPKIVGKFLGGLFRHSRNENLALPRDRGVYFADKMVDLSFGRNYRYRRIEKPRRPDELLDDLVGDTRFVGRGRSRNATPRNAADGCRKPI